MCFLGYLFDEANMDDDFKHADKFEDEIRGLIDDVVGDGLMTATAKENICPKCLALTLLEFAAYAATSSGSTAGEILAATSAGAMAAEDDLELAEEVPPSQVRH